MSYDDIKELIKMADDVLDKHMAAFLLTLKDRECFVHYPDGEYNAVANSGLDGLVHITPLDAQGMRMGGDLAVLPTLAKRKFEDNDKVEFYAC